MVNVYNIKGNKQEIYAIIASNKEFDLCKNDDNYYIAYLNHKINDDDTDYYTHNIGLSEEEFYEKLNSCKFDNVAIYTNQ